MPFRRSSIWIALVSLGGCASGIRPSPPAPDAIGELMLSRSGCWGDCPAYHVYLRRDGTASYFGRAATPRLGAHDARFTPAEFEHLVALLYAERFFRIAAPAEFPAEGQKVTLAVFYTDSGPQVRRIITPPARRPDRLIGAIDSLVARLNWRPAAEPSAALAN